MEEKKNKLKSILSDILLIVVTLVVTFLFSKYIAGVTVVCGDSMNDTYKNSQLLLTNKLEHTPDRFDVIVFNAQNGEILIKRVIGLPGESVHINVHGNIYINDEILDENYGKEKIEEQGLAKNKITLQEDEYFVLGDNRNNSIDSRFSTIGIVKKEDIIGTIFFSK